MCCQLFSSFFVDTDRLTRNIIYGLLGIKTMADTTITEKQNSYHSSTYRERSINLPRKLMLYLVAPELYSNIKRIAH
jgi:hypothetical protein